MAEIISSSSASHGFQRQHLCHSIIMSEEQVSYVAGIKHNKRSVVDKDVYETLLTSNLKEYFDLIDNLIKTLSNFSKLLLLQNYLIEQIQETGDKTTLQTLRLALHLLSVVIHEKNAVLYNLYNYLVVQHYKNQSELLIYYEKTLDFRQTKPVQLWDGFNTPQQITQFFAETYLNHDIDVEGLPADIMRSSFVNPAQNIQQSTEKFTAAIQAYHSYRKIQARFSTLQQTVSKISNQPEDKLSFPLYLNHSVTDLTNNTIAHNTSISQSATDHLAQLFKLSNSPKDIALQDQQSIFYNQPCIACNSTNESNFHHQQTSNLSESLSNSSYASSGTSPSNQPLVSATACRDNALKNETEDTASFTDLQQLNQNTVTTTQNTHIQFSSHTTFPKQFIEFTQQNLTDTVDIKSLENYTDDYKTPSLATQQIQSENVYDTQDEQMEDCECLANSTHNITNDQTSNEQQPKTEDALLCESRMTTEQEQEYNVFERNLDDSQLSIIQKQAPENSSVHSSSEMSICSSSQLDLLETSALSSKTNAPYTSSTEQIFEIVPKETNPAYTDSDISLESVQLASSSHSATENNANILAEPISDERLSLTEACERVSNFRNSHKRRRIGYESPSDNQMFNDSGLHCVEKQERSLCNLFQELDVQLTDAGTSLSDDCELTTMTTSVTTDNNFSLTLSHDDCLSSNDENDSAFHIYSVDKKESTIPKKIHATRRSNAHASRNKRHKNSCNSTLISDSSFYSYLGSSFLSDESLSRHNSSLPSFQNESTPAQSAFLTSVVVHVTGVPISSDDGSSNIHPADGVPCGLVQTNTANSKTFNPNENTELSQDQSVNHHSITFGTRKGRGPLTFEDQPAQPPTSVNSAIINYVYDCLSKMNGIFTMKSKIYQTRLKSYLPEPAQDSHQRYILSITKPPLIPANSSEMQMVVQLRSLDDSTMPHKRIQNTGYRVSDILEDFLTSIVNKIMFLLVVEHQTWYIHAPAREQLTRHLLHFIWPLRPAIQNNFRTFFLNFVEVRVRHFRDSVARHFREKAKHRDKSEYSAQVTYQPPPQTTTTQPISTSVRFTRSRSSLAEKKVSLEVSAS